MSTLQEQAVQMISDLSDDNVSFLIEVIRRLMPQKSHSKSDDIMINEESMQAFRRLEEARMKFANICQRTMTRIKN